MTATNLTDATKTVTRLWETAIAVRTLDLTGIIRDPAPLLDPPGAPQQEVVPIAGLLADPEALRRQFLAAMQDLGERGPVGGTIGRRVAGVDLVAEMWRSGYEVPMYSSPSDLVGWCFIEASPPRHQDSGSVAVLDPRAGSEGTAMPGLPWGREFSFRPTPGLLAVVPGWLTSTVRPVEDGQTVIVVVAQSTP